MFAPFGYEIKCGTRGGVIKVLTLIEPWATLIAKGIKKVETRSWKTNYKGELYIHSSKRKLTKTAENRDLMKLVDESELQYGKILCKCKLVDCICMTEDYIENIKKSNPTEYLCGIYEVGRYAFILNDIEALDKPIQATGKLGVWNYDIEKESL